MMRHQVQTVFPWAAPIRHADFRLPFGKHQGRTLRLVYKQDRPYLIWLGWQSSLAREGLGRVVREFLADRGKRWVSRS